MNRLLATIIGMLSAAVVCAGHPRLTVSTPAGNSPSQSGFITIRVDIKTTEPFEGRLRLFDTGVPSMQVVHQIAVGPGEFRYETPMPIWPGSNEGVLRVELRDSRGRLVAADSPETPTFMGGSSLHCIGWLMKRQKLDLLSMQTNSSWLQANSLPADPALLGALQVIVITDSGAEPLTQPQANALRTWVASGGKLLIAGDCVTSFEQDHPFLTTFGITLGQRGTTTIPGQVGNEQGLAPATLVWREIITNTTSLRERDAHTRHLGFGTIILLPACLGQLPDPCPPVLAIDVTDHITPPPDGRTDLHSYYDYMSYGGGGALTVYQTTIAGVPALPTPLIALVLIAYVVIAAWAAPRYLRQRQRQNLIWGVSLAIVLVFCLVAQALAMAMRGYQVREVSLVVDDINGTPTGQRSEHFLIVPPNSVSRQLLVPTDAQVIPNTRPDLIWNASSGEIEQAVNAWSASGMTVTHYQPMPKRADSRLAWSANHDLLGDLSLRDPTQPWQACLLHIDDDWYRCTLKNGIITPAGKIDHLYSLLNALKGPFWETGHDTPASDLFLSLFDEDNGEIFQPRIRSNSSRQRPRDDSSSRATQATLYLIGDNPPRLVTTDTDAIVKAGWVVRQTVDIKAPPEHTP